MINSTCALAAPSGTYGNFGGLDICLRQLVCVDCSNVTAAAFPLEQVPCPPAGLGSGYNTRRVVLVLDNNQNLDLDGAFGWWQSPYPEYLAGLSLANTSLVGPQIYLSSMTIAGDVNLSGAHVAGAVDTGAFNGAQVRGSLDLSGATLSGGVTGAAFQGATISRDLLMVGTVVGPPGIQPGAFSGTTVRNVLNAAHARFPNNTLPTQMLSGLQAQRSVDFSYCNLEHLEVRPCSLSGCTSNAAGAEYTAIGASLLEGGPFTGMAMSAGVAGVAANLSHNRLTKIINTSLLGITASIVDLSFNQISTYDPFWYHGIPNAQTIITIGNHNTCRRATDNRSADRMAGYSNQVSGAITCDCVYPGTHGTGSFCANDTCLHTLEALNAFAHASLGGGQFSSPYMTPQQTVHAGGVRSGEYAELQCPEGTQPNNASAVRVRCLGGAFKQQTNMCVADPTDTSAMTSAGIAGIVVGFLAALTLTTAVLWHYLKGHDTPLVFASGPVDDGNGNGVGDALKWKTYTGTWQSFLDADQSRALKRAIQQYGLEHHWFTQADIKVGDTKVRTWIKKLEDNLASSDGPGRLDAFYTRIGQGLPGLPQKDVVCEIQRQFGKGKHIGIKRGIDLTQGSGGTYAAGNIDDKLNALILGQQGGWKEAWLGKVSQAFQEVAERHKGKDVWVIAVKGGPACDWEREQLNGVVKKALGEHFTVVELATYDEYDTWLQNDFKKITHPHKFRARVAKSLSRTTANHAYATVPDLEHGGETTDRKRLLDVSTDSYAAAQN